MHRSKVLVVLDQCLTSIWAAENIEFSYFDMHNAYAKVSLTLNDPIPPLLPGAPDNSPPAEFRGMWPNYAI